MNPHFMRRALELARLSHPSPNPRVGCVIVKNNTIIAEGYHTKAGLPHAEIEAIKKRQGYLSDAIMYVTLEPCCHTTKRTPPCTDAIIKTGIKEVVIACKDSNPAVNGKGITALKNAAINVTVGVLEYEAQKLNEAYAHWITTKKPFVILKLATSLDGKIALKTGYHIWITNEASRNYVHQLRHEVDAILVGINTVLRDDPTLTCRIKCTKDNHDKDNNNRDNNDQDNHHGHHHDPLRVILDSTLKIPLTANVLKDTNVLIATTHNADKEKCTALKKRGIRVVVFNNVKRTIAKKERIVPFSELMAELGEGDITSVMIEGGAMVAGEALAAGVVHKVIWFIAPKIIGSEGITALSTAESDGFHSLNTVVQLRNIERKYFGDDVCVEGYL